VLALELGDRNGTCHLLAATFAHPAMAERTLNVQACIGATSHVPVRNGLPNFRRLAKEANGHDHG